MTLVGLMSPHNTKTVCVVTVCCKRTLMHSGLFSVIFVTPTAFVFSFRVRFKSTNRC